MTASHAYKTKDILFAYCESFVILSIKGGWMIVTIIVMYRNYAYTDIWPDSVLLVCLEHFS